MLHHFGRFCLAKFIPICLSGGIVSEVFAIGRGETFVLL